MKKPTAKDNEPIARKNVWTTKTPFFFMKIPRLGWFRLNPLPNKKKAFSVFDNLFIVKVLTHQGHAYSSDARLLIRGPVYLRPAFWGTGPLHLTGTGPLNTSTFTVVNAWPIVGMKYHGHFLISDFFINVAFSLFEVHGCPALLLYCSGFQTTSTTLGCRLTEVFKEQGQAQQRGSVRHIAQCQMGRSTG